jgi:hypothetical protein
LIGYTQADFDFNDDMIVGAVRYSKGRCTMKWMIGLSLGLLMASATIEARADTVTLANPPAITTLQATGFNSNSFDIGSIIAAESANLGTDGQYIISITAYGTESFFLAAGPNTASFTFGGAYNSYSTLPPDYGARASGSVNLVFVNVPLSASTFSYTALVDNGVDDNATISDISIVAEISTPEPATWAIMLLGMFSVGGAVRARRGGSFLSAFTA